MAVFEDLQWADAESLALFARLALAPRLPLLLVGTYRTENLGRRVLAELLADLERRRSVERLELRPLARSEVGELLAAVSGRAAPLPAAEAVHSRTAGNPFFIEELVVAASGAPIEELAYLPLPTSLTEAVLGHLDGLGPLERRVVEAAAVLGQRIPFDALGSVTGVGEATLIDALRVLVGRGLLLEAAPDVFSFRHALTREAVTGRLLGRERRRLHEKALGALQETGSDDWAALAHHAAAAGRFDDVAAAARRGAAAYLRAGATLQARALAELGLEEAGGDLELLELAARAAWSVGLRQSAIDRAEQWRQLAETSGDDRALFQALRLLSRLRWEDGQRQHQRRLTDEALHVAERLGASEELAAAYNLVAETKMLDYENEAALPWARRALALADEIGATHLLPGILVNEAATLVELPGRREEGAARLEEALAVAETEDDDVALLRGLHNLAVAMYLHWPSQRIHSLLDRMEAVVERSGRLDWDDDIPALRALLDEVDGNLVPARATLAAARRARADPCPKGWWATIHEARLALEAGDEALAAELTEQARARASADREQLMSVDGLAVELAARRGDLPGMTAPLAAMAAQFEGRDLRGWFWWSEAMFLALRAALRGGLDPAAVRGYVDDPVVGPPLADDIHRDPAWGPHLEGALRGAEGDSEGALKAYTEALADHGRKRSPSLTADVHQGAARALLALGRTDEAKDHAEAAVRLLDRWPGWRRVEAETLLRRLGGGPAPEGTPTLTAREREVAALVAEGLSNAEVGRRLYISTKTASVHVSNILAKLGMSSRAEVAAWAVREGLAG